MGRNTDRAHQDDANGLIGGHALSAPARQCAARSVDGLEGADGRAALPQRILSGATFDVSRLRSRNEAHGGVGAGATTEHSNHGGIGAFSWLMGTTALVILVSSGAALAAECLSEAPPPPPPIQKFATNTTPTAEVLNNEGVSGCTGGERFINGGGGQGGGDATQVTLVPPGTSPAKRTPPVGAISNGGDGGRGANELVETGNASATAGRGGAGGAGAVASQTFFGEIDDSSGAASVVVSAKGGDGGDGGHAEAGGFGSSTGGAGGDGGVSGRSNLKAHLITRKGTLSEAIAVFIQVDGGNGGDGGDADCCLTARGGNGGVGGDSLGAKASIDGFNRDNPSLNVNEGAIIATARGGDGGAGGQGDAEDNKPGSGGRGGAGGDLTVALGSLSRIVAASEGALPAGAFVHSNGGAGGDGGDVRQSIGTGGGAGLAGSGGTVKTSINGLLQTSGAHMHGALVQSVGGGGASGGSSQDFFFGKGVPGQNGGDGGSVTIATDDIPDAQGANGRVRVFGRNAVGILAQSIGGGGGAAGDVTTFAPGVPAVAIGADGGAGGAGGPVQVTLGESFITSASPDAQPTTDKAEFGGGGVLAQSIAGAGGAAGSAAAYGVGFFTVAIGSTGGKGGAAGDVTVTNNDTLITTYGAHGVGIDAHSIGGGGGKGGSAFSLSASQVFNASVSVGGDGGSGGVGGKATITNAGQIVTYGSDAVGLKAKSVGGGGGHGGAAIATSIALSTVPEVPSLSVSYSLGGTGGSGNVSDQAVVTNSGFVATGGHGAHAIVAQSVAGGGGMGGDSSASAFVGGKADVQISISASVGGDGGSGAQANLARVSNSGLLATFGDNASAIVAQSVGGGGGIAGSGNNTAEIDDQAKYGLTFSLALGGHGGKGGQGNFVTVANMGGIATSGDGSSGVLAQSIGGGGGAAGAATATANGGNLALSVAVGGVGGSGNNSGAVVVNNTNTIVTAGVDSAAIHAQSIGGGGGKGGKGGATAGGAVRSPQLAMANSLQNGLNNNEPVTSPESGVLKVGFGAFDTDNIDPSQLTDLIDKIDKADEGAPPDAPNVMLAFGIGGAGGAGGDGNTVEIGNSGQISTQLAMSDGILAQSVGGGGGHGGVSSSTISDKVDITLELGGVNRSSGDGGQVKVTTTENSHIRTVGVAATGILAQSIGGGGGALRVSGHEGVAAKGGVLDGAELTIGGESRNRDAKDPGGTNGKGGTVRITLSGGSIRTTGKHGVGIIAQSIGGGGGISHLVSTEDIDLSTVNNAELDNFSIAPRFGGMKNGGGSADAVDITIASLNAPNGSVAIATTGRGAHGVLAQSLGGFGGAAIGGVAKSDLDPTGRDYLVPESFSAQGDAGAVSITVNNIVKTQGDGAYGLFAQSIGGGGGFAGDFAERNVDQKLFPFSEIPDLGAYKGAGGAINISMNTGAILTSGDSSDALFVQSIGGGGGHIGTESGIFSGAYLGDGKGGPIEIALVADATVPGFKGVPNVIAMGVEADGISAQSDGGRGGSPIRVDVGFGSTVAGGMGKASAIRLRGGDRSLTAPNIINNAGTIRGYQPSAFSSAIRVERATTLTNVGTVTGNLLGPVEPGKGSLMIDNRPTGVLELGPTVRLGAGGIIKSAGAIAVGGSERASRTEMVGNLVQTSGGRLLVDLDTANDTPGAVTADLLTVEGAVALDGVVAINPITLQRGKTTLLSATKGVTATANFGAEAGHVFRHDLAVEGNTLTLETDADFTGVTGTQGRTRASLARNLQTIWDSEQLSFGEGFAALAMVQGAGDYSRALDQLSGEAIGGVSTIRVNSSLRLAQSTFNCPTFVGVTAMLAEGGCNWGRVEGFSFNQDANGSSVDYDGNATIVMLGGQRQLDDGPYFLSGGVGYENSRLNSDLAQTNVDGKAVLAAVALKWQDGPLTLSGAFDMGYGWYDSVRKLNFNGTTRKARASNNSFNAGVHFRAAYQMTRDDWYLQPRIDLSMNYLRLDGYKESGAGPFNLNVDAMDGLIFAATPAVRLGRRIHLKDGTTLNAFVDSGVSFLSGNDWKTDAQFASAPGGTGGFTSTLDAPDIIGRLGAGIEVLNAGRVSIKAQYDVDFGKDYFSHSASLRVNIAF